MFQTPDLVGGRGQVVLRKVLEPERCLPALCPTPRFLLERKISFQGKFSDAPPHQGLSLWFHCGLLAILGLSCHTSPLTASQKVSRAPGPGWQMGDSSGVCPHVWKLWWRKQLVQPLG